MSASAYRFSLLAVGAGLVILSMVMPSLGLPFLRSALPVLLAGVGAGVLEGRRRAQTGRSHLAEAILLPLAVIALAIAVYRVWWNITVPNPAPDDGMAFGLFLAGFAVGAAVFAVVVALTAMLWARRNKA